MVKPSSRQIGKCGELLVQYKLLKYGIESSSLTTDTGVDLVAFDKVKQKAVTIQVKTSTHHSVPGDKWGKWLEWWIPDGCPADYIAAVDVDSDKFWLISTEQFQQMGHRSGGGYRLWWYIPGHRPERAKVSREEDFSIYEMDAAILKVFEVDEG